MRDDYVRKWLTWTGVEFQRLTAMTVKAVTARAIGTKATQTRKKSPRRPSSCSDAGSARA